jgi:hypothetical protein
MRKEILPVILQNDLTDELLMRGFSDFEPLSLVTLLYDSAADNQDYVCFLNSPKLWEKRLADYLEGVGALFEANEEKELSYHIGIAICEILEEHGLSSSGYPKVLIEVL